MAVIFLLQSGYEMWFTFALGFAYTRFFANRDLCSRVRLTTKKSDPRQLAAGDLKGRYAC